MKIPKGKKKFTKERNAPDFHILIFFKSCNFLKEKKKGLRSQLKS